MVHPLRHKRASSFALSIVVTSRWLPLLVWLAGACSGASTAVRPALENRSDNLRGFFELQGVLERGPVLQLTSNVLSALLKHAHRECVDTFLSSPEHVSSRAINLYITHVGRAFDSLCSRSPDPELCRAIQGGCVTAGWAVFCDQGAMERLRLLSINGFLDAYQTLVLRYSGEANAIPHVEAPLSAIAEYEAARRQSDTLYEDYTPSIRTTTRTVHSINSIAPSIMTAVALSVILGHELSHVEAFGCPNARFAFDSSQKDALDLYTKMVCLPVSEEEAFADYRGIELTQVLLDDMVRDAPRTIVEVAPAMKNDEAAKAVVRVKQMTVDWISDHLRAMAAIAVANVGLYQAVAGNDPKHGAEIFGAEPHSSDHAELARYYYTHARDQWFLKGPPIPGPHMLMSMRVATLMATMDYEDEYPAMFPEHQRIPARLVQSLIGNITGATKVFCNKEDRQAHIDAFGLVMGTAFWRHALQISEQDARKVQP